MHKLWEIVKDLGWSLDEVLEKTILAMRSCEDSIAQELAALCG